MHFALTILKKGKREKITIHYIYTCARRARRKRIKTFYKHAGLGGGGSVSIVAASYKPQNVLCYFFKSLCEFFRVINTKRIAKVYSLFGTF